MLDVHLISAFGKVQLENLTREDVQSLPWPDAKQAQTRGGDTRN
jgi:hypothetical protein